MKKIKVGDQVTIRSDLTQGNMFGDEFYVTDSMAAMAGEKVTIIDSWDTYYGTAYKVSNSTWTWRDQCFAEGIGQTIIIHTDGHTTTALLKEGKRVVKSAAARCNPADTYNYTVGAQLAFNRLMYGTDYRQAEVTFKGAVAEDKPAQEPVKLYCVKDYSPGEWCTRGEVYEIARDGARITYDDGWTCGLSIETDTFNGVKIVPNYLIPLVARPAKVGEWVYLQEEPHANKQYPSKHHKGDIAKIEMFGCMPSVLAINGTDWVGFHADEYLVLDGYQPESEYWSGKVVCVESTGVCHTVGRVYTFKDGLVDSDIETSEPYNKGRPVHTLKEINNRQPDKFIEYKGGADEK